MKNLYLILLIILFSSCSMQYYHPQVYGKPAAVYQFDCLDDSNRTLYWKMVASEDYSVLITEVFNADFQIVERSIEKVKKKGLKGYWSMDSLLIFSYRKGVLQDSFNYEIGRNDAVIGPKLKSTAKLEAIIHYNESEKDRFYKERTYIKEDTNRYGADSIEFYILYKDSISFSKLNKPNQKPASFSQLLYFTDHKGLTKMLRTGGSGTLTFIRTKEMTLAEFDQLRISAIDNMQ